MLQMIYENRSRDKLFTAPSAQLEMPSRAENLGRYALEEERLISKSLKRKLIMSRLVATLSDRFPE